jgi:hypothetical protein
MFSGSDHFVNNTLQIVRHSLREFDFEKHDKSIYVIREFGALLNGRQVLIIILKFLNVFRGQIHAENVLVVPRLSPWPIFLIN